MTRLANNEKSQLSRTFFKEIIYIVTKRGALILWLRYLRCPVPSSATHQEGSVTPNHPVPVGSSVGWAQRTKYVRWKWARKRGLGSSPELLITALSLYHLPTCLMCRRDLKTDNFRGCQFPQSKCKEKSVGHLVSSRPSAPSGKTGAFSSSSASELSQLSDSSSKSAK